MSDTRNKASVQGSVRSQGSHSQGCLCGSSGATTDLRRAVLFPEPTVGTIKPTGDVWTSSLIRDFTFRAHPRSTVV